MQFTLLILLNHPYWTCIVLLYQGLSAGKETETPLKESTRAERASFFTRRVARAGVIHSKKPTSSVEGDIAGGSTTGSLALPKQEASTATSKSYTFKEGIYIILAF